MKGITWAIIGVLGMGIIYTTLSGTTITGRLEEGGVITNPIDQVIKDQIQEEQEEQVSEQQKIEPTVGEENHGELTDTDLREELLEQEEILEATKEATGIDLDLTTLSSTMVFAKVYDVVMDPESYLEKIFKMQGYIQLGQLEETGEEVYALIIPDALGCCQQGFEIQFPDGQSLLEMKQDMQVEVTGTFKQGMYNGYPYFYIEVSEIKEQVAQSK